MLKPKDKNQYSTYSYNPKIKMPTSQKPNDKTPSPSLNEVDDVSKYVDIGWKVSVCLLMFVLICYFSC